MDVGAVGGRAEVVEVEEEGMAGVGAGGGGAVLAEEAGWVFTVGLRAVLEVGAS